MIILAIIYFFNLFFTIFMSMRDAGTGGPLMIAISTVGHGYGYNILTIWSYAFFQFTELTKNNKQDGLYILTEFKT